MMLDIETPALLLSRDVMERNLKHMDDRARQLGVSLRPHIKTHKCLELGRRQLARREGHHRFTLFERKPSRGPLHRPHLAFRSTVAHTPRAADRRDGAICA